jgi:transposase
MSASAFDHVASLLRFGLVPRQNSPGGNGKLGQISKKGNGCLRKLLVVGATSVIRRSKTADLAAAPWIRSLQERRPARVVTVAMANKDGIDRVGRPPARPYLSASLGDLSEIAADAAGRSEP